MSDSGNIYLHGDTPLLLERMFLLLQKICTELFGSNITVDSIDQAALAIPVRGEAAETRVSALIERVYHFYHGVSLDPELVVDGIVEVVSVEGKRCESSVQTLLFGRDITLPLEQHCSLLVYISSLVALIHCRNILL